MSFQFVGSCVKSNFLPRFFILPFFATNNVHFLYFKCNGTLQILSGHMIDSVLWPSRVATTLLSEFTRSVLKRESSKFCWVFCHELEPI